MTNLREINMLRWTVIGIILCITPGRSFEHHETQMQRTIENKRQTIRIRNTILKELKNIGAKIFPVDESVGTSNHKSSVISESSIPAVQTTKPPVTNGVHTTPKPETLVTIGEPSASKRNKCLVFKTGKIVKDNQQIYPLKLHLWVHIRKLKITDGKRNNVKMKQKSAADNKVHDSTKPPLKGDKKRKKEKKQRKEDRQITIFVSDESKVLAKMRMLVQRTNWYKIDLPISQFPEVIRANDSLQLCFKCKQCNKKVKLDLYSKPTMRSEKEKVKIPFIHIEIVSFLPQNNYRYKRSDDKYNKNHNNFDVTISRHSCCKEIVHTENMSSLSPSILYPSSVNISYCETIFKDVVQYNKKPSLSQSSTKEDGGQVICLPREYKSLSMLIFDRSLNIQDVIIRDLIPTGCKCTALNSLK